tara:strand:- start:511 stop:987 length:477 start_codon:yes stop_codon:yes gene_type:complete
MNSATREISFNLNGQPAMSSVPVHMTALTMLRTQFELTGGKLACGEGQCGACTILVDGDSVNGCLMLAVNCDGREVVTIEGLDSVDGLDVVQQAFVDNWAVQCGFCTAGMIMQTRYLLSRNPRPSEEEIKRAIEGNVCRCTGYRKIVDAIVAATEAPK